MISNRKHHPDPFHPRTNFIGPTGLAYILYKESPALATIAEHVEPHWVALITPDGTEWLAGIDNVMYYARSPK